MNNRDSYRGDGLLATLRRYPDSGWIAGVCAGLGDYLGWSTKLIRVLFILAFIFSGFFPVGIVYLVLWYLMDAETGVMGSDAGSSSSTAAPSPAHRRGGRAVNAAEARARFEKLERRLAQMEACVTQEELELRRQFRSLES